jgi:hypothetical protein
MAKKKNLATVLKADLATNMPMSMLAEMVRSHGRGRDTVLAHITPREAAKLKREGGRGSTNPQTGLPEFDDGFDFSGFNYDPGGFSQFSTPSQTWEAPAAPVVSDQTFATQQEPVSFTSQIPSYSPSVYDYSQTPSFSGIGYNVPPSIQMQQAAWSPIQQAASPTYGNVPGAIGAWPNVSPSYAYAMQPGGAAPALPGGSDIARLQVAEAAPGAAAITPAEAAPPAATPAAPEAPQPSTWDKLTGKGGLLEGLTGLKGALALGGLGLGLYQQRRAQQQAQALQDQYNAAAAQMRQQADAQKALAQPFLTKGAEMTGLAAQGALTASRQQAFDAYRAQVAQAASGRGGAVSAAQAGAIEERARQESLNAQQTAGLQLFGTGTTEFNQSVAQTTAAINTELQGLNANVNLSMMAGNAATNFYTNLARFVAGGTGGGMTINIPSGGVTA